MGNSAKRLRGTQLSVIVDVPTYEIENPPHPGEHISTDAGTATVTRTEQIGREQIYWADYGSGIEQPHQAEGIRQKVPQGMIRYIAPSGWIALANPEGTMLNPAYFEPTLTTLPEPTPKRRRHSPKGKASGSIKERVGNKKRKTPTTSYFYEWYEGGRKQQQYIPVRLMAAVREAIARRSSVKSILEMLEK
jgi:hypothetical protein